MQADQNKDITTFQILNKKYGESGSVKREQCEKEFEAFRLVVISQQPGLEEPIKMWLIDLI